MLNEDTMTYGICQISLPLYSENVLNYPNFYNSVVSQDQACEDYTNYRYGNWENAYNFHVKNGWW